MSLGRYHAALLLLCASVGVVFNACSSDKSKSTSGGIDDSCTDCGTTETQKPKDAGKDVLADSDASGVDASDASDAADTSAPYTGPQADVSGTVFAMLSPKFDTKASSGSQIFRPAKITISAMGNEYSGQFDPASGFAIKNVPVGEFSVLVSDIDAGNAILDTTVTASVLDGGSNWELPVATRPSFVVIYGALQPPLYIDGARAQAILSFETCEAKGSTRIAGVKVTAPAGSEGAVYFGTTEWVHENPSGTGTDGTAIIANIPADLFPGKTVTFSYTLDNKTYDNIELRVIQGAVTRLKVIVPC
jgi:hypothetical protein